MKEARTPVFKAWSGAGLNWTRDTVREPTPFDPNRSIEYPVLKSGKALDLLSELERARHGGLLATPARAVARELGRVGDRFALTGDPLRQEALEWLPSTAGVSPAMAIDILDGMARDWTGVRLERTLELEFGDPALLDGFVDLDGRRSHAVGRSPSLHVGSGNVAGVTVTSLVRALLVKGAVLIKPGLGDLVLPVLFHRGLAEAAPELAQASAVWYWRGGDPEEDRVMGGVDGLVVYGGPAVNRKAVRSARPGARVVLHPHGVSAAVVDAVTLESDLDRIAVEAAQAVAAFDRRGCVSPHVLYVEEARPAITERFAHVLARELSRLGRDIPPGPEDPEDASHRHQELGTLRLERAAGEPVEVLEDDGWAVIVDRRPGFAGSPPGRVVRIRPVPSVQAAVDELSGVRSLLQSVALEVTGPRRSELAVALASAGAKRITTLARLPWPPAWWHHDGRGPLAELVDRVDLEG